VLPGGDEVVIVKLVIPWKCK